MQMGSTEPPLARAVFARSIKVLGWQQGPPESQEHDFPKKSCCFFEILRTSDTSLVSVALCNHAYDFYRILLASAVFTRSIRVLGWQPEANKTREHDFPKNSCCFFLKFIGPLTPLWVIYPSGIMQIVFTGSLQARAVFARSIKVLGWQQGPPESQEHDFPKKSCCFFEILRTSDTSLVSVALCNHAYSFYRNFNSQRNVCKVN